MPDGGGVCSTLSATSLTVLVTGEGAGGVAALEISLTVLVTRRAVLVPTFPPLGGRSVSWPVPVGGAVAAAGRR